MSVVCVLGMYVCAGVEEKEGKEDEVHALLASLWLWLKQEMDDLLQWLAPILMNTYVWGVCCVECVVCIVN